MAAITPEATHGADHAGHGGAHHGDHPTDLTFWKVGGFLAVMTAIEVTTIWWEDWGISSKVTAAALVVMMVVKFAVVGGYFMHLKWDAKILQRVFVAGIVLAVTVYLAALAAMVIFEKNGGVASFDNPPRTKPLPPPATDPPPVIKVIKKHG